MHPLSTLWSMHATGPRLPAGFRVLERVECVDRHVRVGGWVAASVKLVYAPQPKPTAIKALAETTITQVACGHNHTVALDDKGAAYSWGGRLPGLRCPSVALFRSLN